MEAELPVRPQQVIDLRADFFLLVRERSESFEPDAFLFRKSDGNAWLISSEDIGEKAADAMRLFFSEDEEASYIYFRERNRDDSEDHVIALRLPHKGTEVTRKDVATASTYNLVGTQDLVVGTLCSGCESYWISSVFGDTSYTNMSSLGDGYVGMFFIENRAYLKDNDGIHEMTSPQSKISYDTGFLLMGRSWELHFAGYDFIGGQEGWIAVDPITK